MLELIYTEEAEQDLIVISDYTERNWGREQKEKYLKMLYNRCEWLTENPTLGRDREQIKKNYYSYHDGKHQIFYTFNDRELHIVAILHESMDYQRHL